MGLLLGAVLPAPAAFIDASGQSYAARNGVSVFRMYVDDPYLEFELEKDLDETTDDKGVTTTDERLDLTPSAGFSLRGHLYHPYFLTYDLVIQQGLTQSDRTIEYGDTKENEDSDYRLQKYYGSLRFLSEKPLTLSLQGSETQTRRNYDQFRSISYRSSDYGADLNFRHEVIPWALSYKQSEDKAVSLERPSVREEDRLNFQIAVLRHDRNRTRFQASRINASQQEGDNPSYEGTSLNAGLFDEQYWGEENRIQLLSSLQMDDLDYENSENRAFRLEEQFGMRHHEKLYSRARYTFENRQATDTDSDRHFGEASVDHRLFESLQSRAVFEAEQYEASGNAYQYEFLRAGPALFESYTKKLPHHSRLQLDLGGRFQYEEQENSGENMAVVSERVRLKDGRVSLLERPNVDAGTIRVRNTSGTTVYLENLDYRVIKRGLYTEIQRVFAGTIPNDTSVIVDYQAQADQSASANTRELQAGFELEYFRGLLTIFANYRNVARSSDGDALAFQDSDSYAAGAKSVISVFEAGASISRVESDTTTYDQLLYYARLNWRPLEDIFMGLEASRSETTYDQFDQGQEVNSAYGTIQYSPVDVLSLSLAGGWFEETGLNFDRELQTAEFDVDFQLGRLSIDTSYKLEEEQRVGEDRTKNFLFLRARRDF